jgi:hypothetical protein
MHFCHNTNQVIKSPHPNKVHLLVSLRQCKICSVLYTSDLSGEPLGAPDRPRCRPCSIGSACLLHHYSSPNIPTLWFLLASVLISVNSAHSPGHHIPRNGSSLRHARDLFLELYRIYISSFVLYTIVHLFSEIYSR